MIAAQSSAPMAHLVKHAVEIYNLLATGSLLFGYCRGFSLQMHKNTQKEYIFDHTCIKWRWIHSVQRVQLPVGWPEGREKERRVDEADEGKGRERWSEGNRREEDGLNVVKDGESSLRDRKFWPDGDVGTLSQPASCTLQSRVDLSHLYCPFQANHLQQLVTEVWMERVTERVCYRRTQTLWVHS